MLGGVSLPSYQILSCRYWAFVVHDFLNHKLIFPLTPTSMYVQTPPGQEYMVAPWMGACELAFRASFFLGRFADLLLLPRMHGFGFDYDSAVGCGLCFGIWFSFWSFLPYYVAVG